ncbi:MAG: hypothetical protein A3D40_00500 [Parcubacteria group bacterium RIFCSPHIGHO2_02_FULL_40_12]|nr:MAG: hypothetical protein A3D40_00500 [Parcubacteria group bacterium RIFCSPHIGHO2_02_FULL_40_12]
MDNPLVIYYLWSIIKLVTKYTASDNQQESLKNIGWIVGFVDGEGTFTVSIFKNEKAQRRL